MYLNKNVLIIYTTLLVFVASFINYFFVAILIFYFTFIFVLYSRPKINTKLKHLYFYLGYLYPLTALVIRFLLDTYYSEFYLLNRIEHALFSLVLTLILYILLLPTIKKLNIIESAALLIGLVVLCGNFNEIAEFIVRPFLSIDYGLKLSLFYSDTIMDIIMNIVGSCAGFITANKLLKIKN